MNLQQLNPWNWFKHEDASNAHHQIPVKREPGDEQKFLSEKNQSLHPIVQLQQEMDRLFDHALKGFGLPGFSSRWPNTTWLGSEAFQPSLNIASDQTRYLVTVEAPGMSDADLSLELKGDALIIRGEKHEERENKDQHFYRIERRYGSFQRTLSLPDDCDRDAIKAEMKNGLLSIQIPRRELPEGMVKRIPVNSEPTRH